MEKRFLEFIADVMDVEPSDITLKTEYGQFDKWDSLMMLTIIMEIEAEYNVSIPMETVGNIKTINDLWIMVREGENHD